jgi:hypothetical protein
LGFKFEIRKEKIGEKMRVEINKKTRISHLAWAVFPLPSAQ